MDHVLQDAHIYYIEQVQEVLVRAIGMPPQQDLHMIKEGSDAPRV